MKLFLDTEFNGFQGSLISMALVPEDSTVREFYKELEIRDQLDPWVRDNVVPHLTLLPCSRYEFQQALAQYLLEVGECTIVADWPDDIRYFCESLIVGPGQMIAFKHNVKFELDTSIEYKSLVPHHALHDARAIKEFYIKRGGGNEMNERIKQLAEQAGMQHPVMGEVCYTDFDHEKFAELIIQECLDVVAMRMNLGPVEICRQECKAVAAEIKQHFGVEE